MNSADLLKYLNTDQKLTDTSAIPEIENLLRNYPASAILHMLNAKMHKSQNSPGNEAAVEMAALYCNDRKKLYNYLNGIKSDVIVHPHIPEYRFDLPDAGNENDPGAENDLISKFLKEKPAFQMTRETESEEEVPLTEPEIITEAMAEIYARQGQTEKAIRTFEKLSLKYPEKSTYFAARIEKIKKN